MAASKVDQEPKMATFDAISSVLYHQNHIHSLHVGMNLDYLSIKSV